MQIITSKLPIRTELDNVQIITLSNTVGTEVKVMNLGATVLSISIPDKHGHFSDILLGYDNLSNYLDNHDYMGAIIGRYANRIKNGRLILDGKLYQLTQNDGLNTLHGGNKGFNNSVWKADYTYAEHNCVTFTLRSEDGAQGFPGNLKTSITYKLTDDNKLVLIYEASSDKTTVFNPTNHMYFNLSNGLDSNILDHMLTIEADYFTPIDSELIPTGEIRSVAGTAFDFRNPALIGKQLKQTDNQLMLGSGFDHNFALRGWKNTATVSKAAELYHPITGRKLSVHTDMPGLQFYSGNFLDSCKKGKKERQHHPHSGLCLETQFFPDSPNRPDFPSALLMAGDKFVSQTIYKFSAE